MADNRPIGVFDSGLGGLSAVKEFNRVLSGENIVYFGDTGRVPYGSKSPETIKKYARQDERFLLSHNVKMVVAACGTVSSVAPETGEELPVQFIQVVAPTAAAAVKATKNKKIGVIGTNATVKSGAYSKKILELDNKCEVIAAPCPLFVPLVESGWIQRDNKVSVEVARIYLKQFIEAGVDTLIMGCTHYPALEDIIADVTENKMSLINSGKEAALEAKQYLESHDMLSERKQGANEFFVSDTPGGFCSTASVLLGHDIGSEVKMVSVDSFSGEKE